MQYAGEVGRQAGQTGQADVSAIGFLGPILAFLVVVIVLTAVLQKSKVLGDNVWVSVFISLFVSAIFVTVTSVRGLLLTVIPWFAVLLIAVFFILVLTTFVSEDGVPKAFLVWLFIIVMVLVFLFAGINIYAGSIGSYVPGPFYGLDADPDLLIFFDWFYSPPVIGAFWLIVAAVVVGWVLIKFSGD